jgi:mono/diheme cytochrome c family protein
MWNFKSLSSERSAVSSQLLRRPDVRKGRAFPGAHVLGLSSQPGIKSRLLERQSLSAHRGGKAAWWSLNISRSRVVILLLLTAHCLLLTAACRRDMQDQPKMIPYRESSFFRDELSSRPLVPGTVPRGYLRADREFYFGKKPNVPNQQASSGSAATVVPAAGASSNPYPDDVEAFPFPITKEALDRGQERYDIFCSVCHGATGNGDGMIARRGFNKPLPASYHQDRLRHAPVGHFFDAITNGWGAMPSYAAQIPVEDRWKIIAYIRALQLSQMPAAQSTPAPNAKPGGQNAGAPGGKK